MRALAIVFALQFSSVNLTEATEAKPKPMITIHRQQRFQVSNAFVKIINAV